MRKLLTFTLTCLALIGGREGPLGQEPSLYVVDTPEAFSSNGAHYLVVSHDSFIGPLLPLLECRASRGYPVRLVPLSFVYAYFDTATCSRPEAIKRAIRYTHEHWMPSPRFVLLVGDANEQGGAKDLLPSPRFPKFSYPYAYDLQEHASDNWYVELTDTAHLPVLAIGRLPVKTPQQVEVIVEKILTWERNAGTGFYSRRATVVSAAEYTDLIRRDIYPVIVASGLALSTIEAGTLPTPALGDSIIRSVNAGTLLLFAFTHADYIQRMWWGGCMDGRPSCVIFSPEALPFLVNRPHFPVVTSFG